MEMPESRLRELAEKPCCPLHSIIFRFLYLVYVLEKEGRIAEGSTETIEDFCVVVELAAPEMDRRHKERERGH